jgi:hypothetical protein
MPKVTPHVGGIPRVNAVDRFKFLEPARIDDSLSGVSVESSARQRMSAEDFIVGTSEFRRAAPLKFDDRQWERGLFRWTSLSGVCAVPFGIGLAQKKRKQRSIVGHKQMRHRCARAPSHRKIDRFCVFLAFRGSQQPFLSQDLVRIRTHWFPFVSTTSLSRVDYLSRTRQTRPRSRVTESNRRVTRLMTSRGRLCRWQLYLA